MNNTVTWEIERLGNGILFRNITSSGSQVIHSTYLPSHFTPTTPLFLDMALFDNSARVAFSAVHGTWVYNAGFSRSVANLDLDGDGRLDSLEQWVVDANADDSIQSIFDVIRADTDGDGLTDEAEFNSNPRTNPARADSDGDGLNDRDENTEGTEPWNPDTDGDGLSDGIEATDTFGFDPLDPDSDPTDDGVGDLTEWQIITDALARGRPQITQVLVTASMTTTETESTTSTKARTALPAADGSDYFLPVAFDRFGVPPPERLDDRNVRCHHLDASRPHRRERQPCGRDQPSRGPGWDPDSLSVSSPFDHRCRWRPDRRGLHPSRP